MVTLLNKIKKHQKQHTLKDQKIKMLQIHTDTLKESLRVNTDLLKATLFYIPLTLRNIVELQIKGNEDYLEYFKEW